MNVYIHFLLLLFSILPLNVSVETAPQKMGTSMRRDVDFEVGSTAVDSIPNSNFQRLFLFGILIMSHEIKLVEPPILLMAGSEIRGQALVEVG